MTQTQNDTVSMNSMNKSQDNAEQDNAE